MGPLVIGAIKQSTGSYSSAMLVLGAFLAFAAILAAGFSPAWAERWMMRSKGGAAGGGDVEAGEAKVVVDARGAA